MQSVLYELAAAKNGAKPCAGASAAGTSDANAPAANAPAANVPAASDKAARKRKAAAESESKGTDDGSDNGSADKWAVLVKEKERAKDAKNERGSASAKGKKRARCESDVGSSSQASTPAAVRQ
eukprot:6185608-Pleurochrysis_carterae.AAC.1